MCYFLGLTFIIQRPIKIFLVSLNRNYKEYLRVNQMLTHVNCRVKGPNHVLGLGPWPRTWAVQGRVNGNEWFKPRTQWAKYK